MAPDTIATSTAEALLALALRCEREEPSRDLDFAIGQVVHGFDRLVVDGTEHWGYRGHYARELSRYTTGLDAAVTLVPEGYKWAVWHDGQARVRVSGPETPAFLAPSWEAFDVTTPALALCAAALRARAAQGGRK